MDFIYYGEVNIIQEDLKYFLSVAQELELRGLTGEEEILVPDNPNENNQGEFKYENMTKPHNPIWNNAQERVILKAEPEHVENRYLQEVTESEIGEQENVSSNESFITVNSEDYKALDEQILAMMEKVEGGWKCKMCGKTDINGRNKQQNMKYHVESCHIEGVAHPCTHCDKKFKSRQDI